VQQLIEHAEAAHAEGWNSGAVGMMSPAARRPQPLPTRSDLERCPHCGREFEDAVALVAHVEQQHGAESSSTCVCS
jgi:hypothetical protein